MLTIACSYADGIEDSIYSDSAAAHMTAGKLPGKTVPDASSAVAPGDTGSETPVIRSSHRRIPAAGNGSADAVRLHERPSPSVEFSLGTGFEYLCMTGITFFLADHAYFQLQAATSIFRSEAAALAGVQWGRRKPAGSSGRVGLGFSWGGDLFSTTCHGAIVQAGIIHYLDKTFAVSITGQVQQRIFAHAPHPTVNDDGGGPEFGSSSEPADFIPSVNVCLVIGM
jgi:hypothetical protein